MPKSKVSKSAPGPGLNQQSTSGLDSGHTKELSPSTESHLTLSVELASEAAAAAACQEGENLAHPGEPAQGAGAKPATPSATGAQSGFELAEKIKELVRLAQEQGYLTYNDINDALPEGIINPEQLDEIYLKLRGLEVEIVDQAEVDRVKAPEREEDEEKTRLDILDDPVRMYLKQMGQVPLLTREQEVEISKRIEAAENELKQIIYGIGFTAKEHIALAEKLLANPPRERFDRVVLDKIESREKYFRALVRLVKVVRKMDQAADDAYAQWRAAAPEARDKSGARFAKYRQKLQAVFGKFCFKQKVIEEMALVAENIHDKIRLYRGAGSMVIEPLEQ